ncbi:GC-rich sequence DNA-binding factor 2 [Oncorhynchus kisutch]|uniref:GC-rich sequence DNA-binding factor 2 n=1 Tax=Oncorhynchus kisutch TaxID=8019 RepID=UPI0012DE7760|nr:GC-rich sequence DNA-binding factor 2 [Oncorhynchus kisutch]
MMTLLNETPSQDSVHKCKKVPACFPQSWFKDVSSCPSHLKSFSDHLLQTAHSVYKQQPDHPNTRPVVSDVLTFLGSIKAWDKGRNIRDFIARADTHVSPIRNDGRLDEVTSTPVAVVRHLGIPVKKYF